MTDKNTKGTAKVAETTIEIEEGVFLCTKFTQYGDIDDSQKRGCAFMTPHGDVFTKEGSND